MKELLLLLARYPFDETNRGILSNLLNGVNDWPALVKLINAHGIIALAAYNIKEAGLDRVVPGDSMAILEKGLIQSIVRNTWLTERWKEVNSILSNAGIKHILLKGMALEHTLYDSKGLRQMNDNDILIKPEDSYKAWHLLQKEGFTMKPFKSPLFKKIMSDLGRHLPALYKNGYALEIHDSLFENEASAEKYQSDLFLNAQEISIGGTKALILSKEMQLKHLNKHFEHHTLTGNCQLRLYNDIVMLDKSCEIKFPERFIENPMMSEKKEFLKAAYKANIFSIPKKHQLRFIIGDMFPSVKWMKERYNIKGLKVLLFYLPRIGKLLWLI